MEPLRRAATSPRVALIALTILITLMVAPVTVQQPGDGSHDFDFEIGEWRTHVRRLQRPLTGSTSWVEYTGTTTVRGVLGQRANIAELIVTGPAGRIEGAALRLYNPAARQWSVHYFNAAEGVLTAPLAGEFRDGRGVFYGQDTLAGRTILVRFVVVKAGADTYRFEQSFSDNGGDTWELNWVATDTRKPAPSVSHRRVPSRR